MIPGQKDSRSTAEGLWLKWLAVGLVAVVVFYLLPERLQSVLFTSLNLSVPVAVLLGIRRWQPERRTAWITFAIGMGVYGAGNAIWYFYNFFVLNESSSIVATANVFYAFGYAVAAIGLLAALAGARSSWRNVAIDSLTVVVGTAVIWWAYLIQPFFTDDSVSFARQLLNAAYPFGDVLLIVAVATTLVATSRRTTAENMRLVGVSGLVVADALYYWSALGNSYEIGTVIDAFWLASFVIIGSASVHPSVAATLDEREPRGQRVRYGVFIAAAIIGPIVIAFDALTGKLVPIEVFAISSVLLFFLVLVRMTGLLREVNEQMEALDGATMGLRHSEERHRSVVNSLNEVVFQTDLRTRWTFLNSAWTELTGFTVEESLGRPAGELVHPDDRDEVILYFASLMEGKNEAIRREARGVDKYGNIKRVEFYVRLLRDRNGQVVGTTGALMDVTERRAAEDALREAEKRFRNLVEQIPVVPYVDLVDERSTNQYISTRLTELAGYTPEEWKEQELWEKVIHPDDRERVLAEHQRSNRDQLAFVAEYRIRHKDGRYIWVRDEAVFVRSEDGEESHWQGVFMDVTHRKVLEDQLVHQAFHDPLTGLANRSLFSDRLSHALSRRGRQGGAPLAVLFLDLDDFKTVNDSLGHASGDQLLKAVATRLEDALRGSDTAARLGGDEFGILVEDLDGVDSARRVAERVIHAIDRPFQLDGREIIMRSSIGIALAEGPEATVDELLRNADLAMYMAKRGGENRWALYEPGMHVAALGRLQMKADLDRSLDEERMVIHYQPIVDLASSRIMGCEALVRWNHGSRGLIGPNEFIPVAEETGFINILGRWVIREACMQLAEWHRKGVGNPHLTVNLSGRQLHDPMLMTDVAQSLAASGLSPSFLTLEITESALMTDIGASIEMLYSLKDLGVQLAIDDFGTGYSSLSYLQRFPLDVLKIDRSFISGMEVGDDDAVLAQAVVRLGQTLRLQTIAEGIEIEEQRAALIRAGCTLGQGYLFSRPVDAAAMQALLLGQSEGVLLLP
jgi:diguanylate cyclase (GGDEF)-like protein/PAS domain S-box-containing protein